MENAHHSGGGDSRAAGGQEPAFLLTHPEFSEAQRETLKAACQARATREVVEILVVEDQEFSRKLLIGMLGRHYKNYAAKNGTQALALYAEHAPDIVFLDVELPDINGHELAHFLREQDPQSFVVMVTGNHCKKDIDIALSNHVQGFIAKPYSRKKIQDALDFFLKTHRQ